MYKARCFTNADDEGTPRVAIVNDTMARRFWPGQQAVGTRVRILGDTIAPMEVVGVVSDSTYVAIGEPSRPFMYRPLTQAYTPRVTVLVRSADTPGSVVATIKREVAAVDRALAVFNAGTLIDATSVSLLPVRVAGTLLGALGAMALTLGGLGIYGVLSYLVRARTRELGVRVALGAPPAAVLALVLRQVVTWTVLGATAGIALALALTRLLAGFLHGLSATDVWTFTGVTLILVLVAAIAAFVPARRASRLDPLVALRML